MWQETMIKEAFLAVVIYELMSTVLTCTYVVESRRVMERAIDLKTEELPSGPCEIPGLMKDRWILVDRPRERMRIRGNVMVVKYGNTRLKYKCLESKGHTFLLGTSDYLGHRQGVLCLGFAQINNNDVADYSVVRLNARGLERTLLSPQILPKYTDTFPSLNETCVLTGGDRDYYALIRRTERRCVFPDELIRSWNFTYRSAKHVAFAKKTFTITLMDGNKTRFDCSINDGDLYVLRSPGFKEPSTDGIVCFNITKLIEDPHYQYEMSRLNSGEQPSAGSGHLVEMIKLFPAGKLISLYDHCDWLDSPARPQYLY
ncbi:uncharacterized protein LOC123546089 [Mercenaria mercenaria]|uniref:uncharacterized protein LOC123546089 n=1 Tax=Mercenaria mercenaria TaxID=6596 RepID=UPI00234EB1F7|nr:uncharacterized protein LOC123546089 [Mercenaria mercenaria]